MVYQQLGLPIIKWIRTEPEDTCLCYLFKSADWSRSALVK